MPRPDAAEAQDLDVVLQRCLPARDLPTRTAAPFTAAPTTSKMQEIKCIPAVLAYTIHIFLNALRKPETHLYLAVYIATCDLHVSGIHGFYIQFGQPLNGLDKLRRVASVHIRSADVAVRKYGVS